MARARRIWRRRGIGRAVGDEQAAELRDDGTAAEGTVEQIRELAELREQGVLTEEEFTAEKKRLLEP
jgi:Short C-terminal domain